MYLMERNTTIGRRVKRRHITEQARYDIAESQGYLCNVCDLPLENTFQIDHIVPLAANGKSNITNLHALCPNCHARKTKREFLLVRRNTEMISKRLGSVFFICGKDNFFVSNQRKHKCSGFYYKPRNEKKKQKISAEILERIRHISMSGCNDVIK